MLLRRSIKLFSSIFTYFPNVIYTTRTKLLFNNLRVHQLLLLLMLKNFLELLIQVLLFHLEAVLDVVNHFLLVTVDLQKFKAVEELVGQSFVPVLRVYLVDIEFVDHLIASRLTQLLLQLLGQSFLSKTVAVVSFVKERLFDPRHLHPVNG